GRQLGRVLPERGREHARGLHGWFVAQAGGIVDEREGRDQRDVSRRRGEEACLARVQPRGKEEDECAQTVQGERRRGLGQAPRRGVGEGGRSVLVDGKTPELVVHLADGPQNVRQHPEVREV